MDVEILNFVKVWIAAMTCLCYCYYIVSNLPKGVIRLLFLLPIIYLFIILPLNLSSFHLGGPTIFYLVCLGNFKLLLFAFHQGPLSSSSSHPPLSLLHFISIALLPIKTKTKPFSQETIHSVRTEKLIDQSKWTQELSDDKHVGIQTRQHPFVKTHKLALFAIKALLLAIIIRIYHFRQHVHPYVILALYCCHVYLGVELVLFITAIPVQAILGLEIEPQFNEPYLATSLQDFWGRRWNLMVTSILRPTVYYPVKSISTRMLSRRWSTMLAIFATFLVSGLIHEVIYYYFTRVRPTWEVTWFFVLHGICTAFEVAIKKALNGKWRLHRVVSGPITVAFVAVTGVWLFLPQIIRNGVDQKAIDEYSILVHFFRDKVRGF